jgi:hypothetical protein
MTGGALFWIILCGISVILFFGIAAVVSVRGVGDLRDLLEGAKKRDKRSEPNEHNAARRTE